MLATDVSTGRPQITMTCTRLLTSGFRLNDGLLRELILAGSEKLVLPIVIQGFLGFLNFQLTKSDHLTLKMASTQVLETSVANNSPSQDSNHPDDHEFYVE